MPSVLYAFDEEHEHQLAETESQWPRGASNTRAPSFQRLLGMDLSMRFNQVTVMPYSTEVA